MRYLTSLLVGLLWMPTASATLICREKSTGKVLETQEFGVAGTCLKNYVTDNPQYGYTAADIEELLVSKQDAQAALTAWENNALNPDVVKRKQAQDEQQVHVSNAKAKLNLSDADLEDLEAALR